ncbi:MAG: sodium/glutamate symporter [Pseudomonadota bacterium]
MEAELLVPSFLTFTVGIVVYFVGMQLNAKVGFLRDYNIPEPVTGGVLASLVVLAIFYVTERELIFELEARDILLVYFFTTIGINARIQDLLSGGRPLLIFLALTLGYIVFQNLVGVGAALAIEQPAGVGLLVGSVSLIGGHGTTIAWSEELSSLPGMANALEIGVAAATFGLIIAGLIGGPIAKLLMRGQRVADAPGERLLVGLPHEVADTEQINHISIMRVILVIHVAIIIGYGLDEALSDLGVKLPLFVSCLLVAILLSNTTPYLLPRLVWPARTRALAIVSDFSLGLFIAMSLMGMQLWTLADLAGPLLILLGAQVAGVVLFILFLVFPLMGRDYLATVMSAGFAGFALGATPTAIANMTAVTKTHGPSPQAFIILPLVGAFFVDIANALVIQAFLAL